MEIKLIQAKKLIHWIRIKRLYKKAFPLNERKPFFIIKSMQRTGKTDVWYLEKDGEFAGLVTTINGSDLILVDYLAIRKDKRGMGIGSETLGAIREKYPDKGIFLEIERIHSSAENLDERIKRKHFYLSNGASELGTYARLFGVEMEMLGWDCEMDYEKYRSFYKENYDVSGNVAPSLIPPKAEVEEK